MADFFTGRYVFLWGLALALALFFPMRQLIWALAVRRAIKREGDIDEPRSMALKKRANVTAALLSFVFSFFYAVTVMRDS